MSKASFHILLSKWYFFLLSPLLGGLAFYGLDTSLTGLKKEEKMALFVTAKSFDETALQKRISSVKPASILSLEEHFAVEGQNGIETTYNAFGPGYSDVLVLKEDYFVKALPQLAVLSSSALDSYYPNASTYQKGELVYGVMVHKAAGQSPASITFNVQDNYYLCFSKNSVHLSSSGTDEAALVLGKAFFDL